MQLYIDGKAIQARPQQSLRELVCALGLDDRCLSRRPLAARIAGEVFTLNYIPQREQEAEGDRPSMRRAMDETERRREKQDAFNKAHGIVPKTVIKSVRALLDISAEGEDTPEKKGEVQGLTKQQKAERIARLEKEMREAAKMLEFELAAALRDQIIELRGK